MAAKTPPTSPVEMIAALAALGEMRVWSVLITIFGDAVAARGGQVSAMTLQTILDRLRFKPEAMRVAIHRLVKDGWISRDKQGRQSYYKLSKEGRAEFLPATQRIYAEAPALAGPWQLAILPPMPEKQRGEAKKRYSDAGYLAVSPTCFIAPAGTPAPKDDQALNLDAPLAQVPNWVRETLGPPHLQIEYQQLERMLERLSRTKVTQGDEAAALRVIMIHQWRRVLLRHADLPAELLPATWRGEACRALVLQEHKRLSALADPWLDNEIGSGTAALAC
ncbi:PaaX family transcriptional regulator [Candidatus Rhodobacter oscarellae]|nr:PaaX family transcriptional regulator C-terminal domain-containing protein [Candidatus Rhodobacter lobularis]